MRASRFRRVSVNIQTSTDPVGAPIFYRDVPLIPTPPDQGERGVIKPLPDSVLPKIKWRLRYVSGTENKVVMDGLPTCANCHSIARDGKTLGIDVDGPQNDKGLYGLIPIHKVSSISNDYVIHWSAFSDKLAQKRFGFMSQVSPDGKYRDHLDRRARRTWNARGRPALQRVLHRLWIRPGVLSDAGRAGVVQQGDWHSCMFCRERMIRNTCRRARSGVPTASIWSTREASAKDPYETGHPRALYANDPNETQMQYDLYRIPFNDGKGGKAEKLMGASENGMSNNFPKVSPDGKWIVFVRNKNGLLMRPDSHLYIVPFDGRKRADAQLQPEDDELVAQLVAERALAGVLVEDAVALYADVSHAHR